MHFVQKVTVLNFKIFMSRLADSTSHPLVHLTLARLFQNLNRWKILQNKTFTIMGRGSRVCLQCRILLRPGAQDPMPLVAFLWCKKGLEALAEVVPSLIWPGVDSPIPGTGGDDIR